MFITTDDFKQLIDSDDLDIVSNSEEEKINSCIATAIEEMEGYLRTRYNVASIFSETGDDRNKIVLTYCIDITLYHMHTAIAMRQMPEVRQIRYDRAIKWLEQVQKGLINPNLPALVGSDNEPEVGIRYGSTSNLSSW